MVIMIDAININTKYLKNHALQCSQLLSPISFMNSCQYRRLLTNTESLCTILLTDADYHIWTHLHLRYIGSIMILEKMHATLSNSNIMKVGAQINIH